MERNIIMEELIKMVTINQGQTSTLLISVYGAIVTILVAYPEILGAMGVPIRTATIIIGVMSIIWNYIRPRNDEEPPVNEGA